MATPSIERTLWSCYSLSARLQGHGARRGAGEPAAAGGGAGEPAAARKRCVAELEAKSCIKLEFEAFGSYPSTDTATIERHPRRRQLRVSTVSINRRLCGFLGSAHRHGQGCEGDQTEGA